MKKYIQKSIKWLVIILLSFIVNNSFSQASGTISLSDPTSTLQGCLTGGFTLNVNAFPTGGSTTYPILMEVEFTFDSKLTSPSFSIPLGWTSCGINKYCYSITSGSYSGSITGNYTASSAGDYKNCLQNYSATLKVNGVLVGTQTHSVTLTNANKWTINKSVVGIVNTNTIRYKIDIYSPNCNGAYNLYNALIQDNPNMLGKIVWSNSPGFSHSAYGLTSINFIPFGGVLNRGTYVIYIDVKYPCTLSVGTTVCNLARLKGSSPLACNRPPALAPIDIDMPSNNACIPLPKFVGLTSDPIASKTLGDATRNNSTGCQNSYVITLKNDQPYNIDQIKITDIFPCGLINDIPSVSFYYNGSIMIPPTSTGSLCPGGSITWTYPPAFTLMPNDIIKIVIPFQVTAPTGTNVCNKAIIQGRGFSVYGTDLCTGVPISSHPFSLPVQKCFNVEAIAPRPIIQKSIPSGILNYTAGDLIHFKVCISNYGGAPFTGAFSDFIDPAVFNAPTNIKVFMKNPASSICDVSGAFDINTGGSIISFNSATKKLEGTLNVLGQCLLNQYSNVVIEYDALVKNNPFPCAYRNTANIMVNGTNYSHFIDFNIKLSSALSMLKEISVDGGATYHLAANAAPGQTVKYKITLQNISLFSLKNIKILDNLPNGPDNELYSITPLIPRNVSGTPLLTTTSAMPTFPPGSLIATSSSKSSLFTPIPPCAQTPSAYVSGNKAVYFDYGSNILNPTQTTSVIFDAKVDPSANVGTIAVNDAFICSDLVLGTPPVTCVTPFTTIADQLSTITNPALLSIVKFEPPCCKDMTFSASLDSSKNFALSDLVNLWSPYLHVSYSGLPVRRFTVSVVDANISYSNTVCANEYTPYQAIATVIPQSSIIGNLYQASPSYSPYSPPNWFKREAIWDIYSGPGSATSFHSPGIDVPLFILLPGLKPLSCCTGTAHIVLKFTFEDNNCNVCDFFQDFNVDLSKMVSIPKDLKKGNPLLQVPNSISFITPQN